MKVIMFPEEILSQERAEASKKKTSKKKTSKKKTGVESIMRKT